MSARVREAAKAAVRSFDYGGKAAVCPLARGAVIAPVAQINEHGRIIAAAAKAVLTPLKFQRKGASRVWLADHGYWLDAVEFQPSAFSKGTYCNVAVHWLWGTIPDLTFDYGFRRIGSFVPFGDPDAFSQAVAEMARGAVQAVEGHRAIFSSLTVTATHLASHELSEADMGGWNTFHAGVACGLIRNDAAARQMFDRVSAIDDRDLDWVRRRRRKAERLATLLGDHGAFRAEVQALLNAQRDFFKLAPFTLPGRSDALRAKGS